MKLWHLAAILLVLGIGYVLISRPTIPSVSANQQANVSNSIWSGIIGGGINAVSKYLGKATPNSAADPLALSSFESSESDKAAALGAYDSGPGYSYGP